MGWNQQFIQIITRILANKDLLSQSAKKLSERRKNLYPQENSIEVSKIIAPIPAAHSGNHFTASAFKNIAAWSYLLPK
ncbi:hypothetical protein RQN30_04875 [Arcanobacterium hippocoleae]